MNKFYPPKPKINAFNELFQCYLCQGYLINPTTIDACLHSYCRSCIVKHLAEDCYCPRCKGSGGKALTHSNLKSDNVLRSIIYKLVPGLYQKERERVVQFVNNAKNEESPSSDTLNALLESDDDFYTARDSISLSLEFHPHLAQQCEEADIPPVRYLKCLASLKIQHLKRFLCSKFDIDPSNRKVDIEVIYEDEVLPSDFTLMDVAYCYQYKGQAPLKLYYRILIYQEEHLNTPELDNQNVLKHTDTEISTTQPGSETKKSLKDENENPFLTPTPVTTKLKTSKQPASKHQSAEPSVKLTISSKPTESVKKTVSKRSSLVEDFTLPTTTTNDFKSLRSNDIRYSQFGAPPTPPATPNASSINSAASKTKVKTPALVIKEEKPAKCDIVVSIPHNQMQDEWDTKPLSQLKTACKKSPPSSSVSDETTSSTTSSNNSKKVRNVPKLKIELNSLKTKLIEKPKSADIRLDTLMLKHHHKPRKFSLDEPQPSNDKVDLETYVKNIGLKPIEVQTSSHTAPAELETAGKFTPNASPRSSCSSSTTSSSNGYLNVSGEHSKSSHKKRKKKHSKESKDAKRSKKMHAEISSQMADESLKMKVKLTTPLNIKPSKLESKKSPQSDKKSLDHFSIEKPLKSPEHKSKHSHDNTKAAEPKKSHTIWDNFQFPSDFQATSSVPKLKPLAIKTTAKDFEDDDDISMPDITTALSLSKPLANIKDSKLPHSPPLPPSLFKTTPLTISTFTPNVNTVAKTKPVVTAAKQIKDKPVVQPLKMKPLAPKPMPTIKPPLKPPQFAVPNLPRSMASNTSKFLPSTPSSIASSANKQMGNLLKRSASMDEGKAAKQSKYDKPHQITVSAYGSNLQVTKVEVPATPTSSTAKATYEIPLYSPLSASYNPKCSFTVGSTTTGSGGRANSLNSPTGLSPGAGNCKSPIFTTNTASLKKPEKELAKQTTAATSPTGSSTNSSLTSFGINKTFPLMGPPASLPKLNTVVPTSVKSPPLGNLLHKSHSSAAVSSSSAQMNARSSLSKTTTSPSPPGQSNKKSESTTLPNPSAATTLKNNNGPVEKPTSSLRQFRLPSRESGQDILDLSPKTTNGIQTAEKKICPKATTTTPTVNIPGSPTLAATGSALEFTLSKIKQNMSSTACAESKPVIDLKPNSEDLQNLHLLSESATAREKIAITSSTSSATATASVYEKPKINTNSLVRQQNASVRSIPNPSALAFRNHQPSATNNIPMVTIAAPLIANLSNEVDKTLLSKQPTSPHSPLTSLPLGSNVTTSSITPLRNTITATSLSSKRHPSIDQVAASLNIRATAAAAEASAKSNLKQLDEIASVTSKSSLAEMNGGSKLKQQIKQEAVEQPTTTTTSTTASAVLAAPTISQPLSAMHLAEVSSSEVVEIKKEPEERCSEPSSSLVGDEQREVKAIFTVSNNNNNIAINNTHQTSAPTPTPASSSALVSKVENLVTSVINVSTPTSSLLTTSSAAGY
ncbi:protein suppressor 2 of zeste isoform X2 [Musca domestica]|nr:protein suppressor 2 of zeste isoform X2 [Musca domestica]